MKTVCSFLLIVLTVFQVLAQKGKAYFLIDTIEPDSLAVSDKALIDSLLPAYHRAQSDTSRLGILSELASGMMDEKIWLQYNRILHRDTKNLLESRRSMHPKERMLIKKYYANSLQNLGYYIQNYNGDQNRAMRYYADCMDIQKEIGDSAGIATTLNNMANTISYQGNVPKALEYYYESLKIRERLHDVEGAAGAYNNLATACMLQRDTAKAMEYLKKSIALLEQIGHLYGLAYTSSNLGVIYRDRKEYQKAREYFQKSLDTWDTLRSDEGVPFALQNLGFILQKEAETLPPSRKKDSLFTQAIALMKKSLAMCENRSDVQGIASVMGYLGNAYLSSGNLSQALHYGQASLRQARQSGFSTHIRSASQLLYKVYSLQGKYKEALAMHELYIQMRDSIVNEESQKSAFKQQMKFDYEKQQALKDAEHEKQAAVAAAESRRQRLFIYFMVAVAAGAAAIAILIFRSLKITRQQKKEIEHQKKIVEVKNKHITDSINYAKRIQDAILPSSEDLSKCFTDHFILFQPREIVSGDFYWVSQHHEMVLLAIADCTGHGVPGAFMSMIGNTLLNEIVNEKKIYEPARILSLLNEGVVQALHQGSRSQEDGMDISVSLFDRKSRRVLFAGANHSLYVVCNGSLEEVKGDIFSVGSTFGKTEGRFTQKEIHIPEDAIVYFFTDGLSDQLGGKNGKKFLSKNLQKLLVSVSPLPMKDQEEKIRTAFNEWKGPYAQLDDILLAGIRL